MTRTPVTVDTPDGPCAATLHTPDGEGPWPGVLQYPDAGGVRETIAAMADALAGRGYAVLSPDIYTAGPTHRSTPRRSSVTPRSSPGSASSPPR